MIQTKTLMAGIEFRIKNWADVSLQDLSHMIHQKANEYNVPVAFKQEQVKDGLIFGPTEECIVLYHPQNEKNYLRYVIRAHHQGTYLFIIVNKTNGFSPDSSFSRSAEAVRSMFPAEGHWYTIIDDIFNELFS